MLRNASTIKGYTIEATDGRIGTIDDILFDDSSWLVRWLVVDTGNWLSGRKVLLPASVLGHIDPKKQDFSVRLTMSQVEHSPDIDTQRPVSRQMEIYVYDYYGWSPYWSADFYLGGYDDLSNPTTASPSHDIARHQKEISNALRNDGNPHLRSIEAITGYHIHAKDGEIGHIEDFLLQEADWSIHYLVVDTKNLWPGKKVLISPRSVKKIDWASALVSLNVDRQRVKNSPEFDPTMSIDRAFEKKFHNYYSAGQSTHAS
jgi:uncharacterized protein YrrD